MYVPYLKARQFELRALRSIAETIRAGHVLPILDPCDSTRELWSKLRQFTEVEMPCGIIVNPEHGNLGDDPTPIGEAFQGDLAEAEYIMPMFHVRADATLRGLREFLEFYSTRPAGVVLASDHITRHDFEDIVRRYPVRLVAVVQGLPSTYRPDIPNGAVVKIEDGFRPAVQNAAYTEDEFFSELVGNYADQRFDGFGDYLTIGRLFDPGGFIPKAVAIHFTYEVSPGVVRIKHFVSDDKEEQLHELVDKKIKEALDKLVGFVKSKGSFCGSGCISFIQASQATKMPQLGALKQFSIMHHIELMNSILDREDDSDE